MHMHMSCTILQTLLFGGAANLKQKSTLPVHRVFPVPRAEHEELDVRREVAGGGSAAADRAAAEEGAAEEGAVEGETVADVSPAAEALRASEALAAAKQEEAQAAAAEAAAVGAAFAAGGGAGGGGEAAAALAAQLAMADAVELRRVACLHADKLGAGVASRLLGLLHDP